MRVRWPLNCKPSGIEKYDGSTNLTEWLEVYQLAIEAAKGDSYVMANYCRSIFHHLPGPGSSSFSRGWFDLGTTLMGLVQSWNNLRQLFTSNFRATCAWPGVDWDVAALFRRKESPSKNTSSAFTTRGMSSWRLMTSRSSCSSRKDLEILPQYESSL
jgi:hypothetical protein